MSRRWRLLAWLVPVLALYAAAVILALDVVSAEPLLARGYALLAGVAGFALLVLLVVVVRALWRVHQRARAGQPGARLTRRLVWRFVLIAVPPALVVYGFSLNFLVLTVDAWFNVRLEHALDDALSLSRIAVNQRLGTVEQTSSRIAEQLNGAPDARLQAILDQVLDRIDALQVAVLSPHGRVLAMASADPRWLSVPHPGTATLNQLATEGRYAAAEPLDNQLVLRVLLPVEAGPGRAQILQALYALPPNVARLSNRVEDARFDFERLKFLRGALKLSFVLILSFVVLLSLLAALLAAVSVARRLLRPVGQLVEATQTLGEGRYDIDLDAGGNDELGFLSESFRGMTQRLRDASEQIRASAAESERRRRYLDTVLERLSSGVMGLDADGVLQRANQTASDILELRLAEQYGRPLDQLRDHWPRLAPLLDCIAGHLGSGGRAWRREVRLPDAAGRALILMLRGTALGDGAGGMVVVFDDLTELSRAQRDAAWGEVAQRLAHEVKNPLTPIQLSAERLSHRLSGKLDEADATVLRRATGTIVNQVDALKTLVDDFRDYARSPRLAAEPLAVDSLVREVLELYGDDPGLVVQADIAAPRARVTADAGKLRQLLHNLIRNAVDARGEGGRVTLDVATRVPPDDSEWELRVADDGPGLPDDFDASWFEPYVSTKTHGSGLGLAVVKKVCEEHGGRVRGANRAQGGAEFVVTLPLEGNPHA